MKAGLKRSKQRDAILEYLKSTTCHPTADTVYENVKEKFPNISLGTVYRNLNLLAECHQILKLTGDGGSDRFDATTEPHYHVRCVDCGEVLDIHMEPLTHINVLAEASFDGKILEHSIFFKGKCKKCIDKEKQQ